MKSLLTKSLLMPTIIAIFVAGLFCGVAATRVMAQQPHMQAALQALINARSQLNAAEADKAGHRVNAIDLVNQAIQQVRMGMRAGAM